MLPLIYVAENSYGNTDRKTYTGTHQICNAYNVEDANSLVYKKDTTSIGNLLSSSAGDKLVD